MACFTCGLNDCSQLGIFVDGLTTETKQSNSLAQIDCRHHIISAACGLRHSLFLTDEGGVLSCGEIWNYECDQHLIKVVRRPEKVEGLDDIKFTQIAASQFCSFALSSEGTVFSWGIKSHDIMARPCQDAFEVIPAPIKFNIHVKTISAGLHHCLTLTEDLSVFGWGRNNFGQVGIGNHLESKPAFVKLPTQVTFPTCTRVISISARHFHSIALVIGTRSKSTLRQNRTVLLGWGKAESVGNVHDEQARSQPQEIISISLKLSKLEERRMKENKKALHIELSQISSGGYHNLALTSCGFVMSWGTGTYGQLGNGKVYDFLNLIT